MFRSIDKECGEEIIILDEKWHQGNIDQLRLKGRSKILHCPECQKPLTVKAGDQKRWHFAHQDLDDCPLRNESAMILQARSLLYKWLQSKFPDKVTIEKKIEECSFPRPVDCYVQLDNGAKIVYWILEAGIRNRSELLWSINESNIQVQWVFLHRLLKEDEKNTDEFYFSPTERDFFNQSDYMKVYNGPSIHYLNIETSDLKTLRGLYLVHSSQKYKCKKVLNGPLDEILISPKTGEFVYLGEYEKLQEYRESQILRQLKMETPIKSKDDFSFMESEIGISEGSKEELTPIKQKSVPPRFKGGNILNEAVPCEICGKITKEWSTFNCGTRTCECRECLQKRSKDNQQAK